MKSCNVPLFLSQTDNKTLDFSNSISLGNTKCMYTQFKKRTREQVREREVCERERERRERRERGRDCELSVKGHYYIIIIHLL